MYSTTFFRHALCLIWDIWTHPQPSDEPKFSLAKKFRLTIPIVLLLLLRPLAAILWLIDDVFFDFYKLIPVKAPIFIISGPRTGSTRLQDVLCNVGDSCASFSLQQLLLPFISLQWLIYQLQQFDEAVLMGTLSHCLEYLQSKCVPEDMKIKHDIRFGNFEENEFWFTFWHLTSVFVTHLMPSASTVRMTFQNMPPAEQDAILDMFYACVQKLLYFHSVRLSVPPSSLRLVCKSHGIERVAAIKRRFEGAMFVTGVRDPWASLASYFSLRRSALKMVTGVCLWAHPSLLWTQYEMDVRYYQEELRCIRSIQFDRTGREGMDESKHDCKHESKDCREEKNEESKGEEKAAKGMVEKAKRSVEKANRTVETSKKTMEKAKKTMEKAVEDITKSTAKETATTTAKKRNYGGLHALVKKKSRDWQEDEVLAHPSKPHTDSATDSICSGEISTKRTRKVLWPASDTSAVVSGRCAGSNWVVYQYTDLIRDLNNTIVTLCHLLDLKTTEKGIARLGVFHAQQQLYASPHKTDCVFERIGYSQQRFWRDFGDYMHFFFGRSAKSAKSATNTTDSTDSTDHSTDVNHQQLEVAKGGKEEGKEEQDRTVSK